MTSMAMMERSGMMGAGTSMQSPGVGSMGGMPGATANMMMVPRCTIKMEKTKEGMCLTCTCTDPTACTMMQNLCTMMAGGMVSCCMMMNGMMVCCCNMTMGMCTCEMSDKGCKISCTSGDAKCCQMIQACCDCMSAMLQAGCTCCVMMNGNPICCGNR
jgi:hypothetical protein